MNTCALRGIGISFLSPFGRFLARVEGPRSGNVLLRREQYRTADQEEGSLRIVRGIVTGKIWNARHLLVRGGRDPSLKIHRKALLEGAQSLRALLKRVPRGVSIGEVRGLEGAAARAYFEKLPCLLKTQSASLVFDGRSRRPPRDPVNAVLSFLYALVLHDCSGALESVGLDPAVGFLHRDRPGRPSLALDLMEEFRPALADRLALTLFNLGQVSERSFVRRDAGAVLLTDAGRKVVITEYQRRKQEEVVHPLLGSRMPLGVVIHVQATLLARTLRGEFEVYPPYTLH